MNGLKNATPANAILEGSVMLHLLHTISISPLKYRILQGTAGNSLPEGSLVVDVGGGVGSQSLTLAKHHPQLRFVVQDRESVVGDAIEVCALNQITQNMACMLTI
jgi:tRNA G46 methylase TrmB